jgi:hypothetical protein
VTVLVGGRLVGIVPIFVVMIVPVPMFRAVGVDVRMRVTEVLVIVVAGDLP